MSISTTYTPLPVDPHGPRGSLDDLRLLNRALLRLSEIQPVDQILQIVLDSVYDLAHEAQYVRLFLMEDSRLKLAAARWPGSSQPAPGSDAPPDAFAFQVVKEAAQRVRRDRLKKEHSGGVVGFPCCIGSEARGALLVSFASLAAVTPEKNEQLQILAHQAARAVDTSHKFQLLSRQAYTDALTGLPNRRALDERLEDEIRRSSRYQHVFTLIMIDLNSFKAINDSLGHPAGDQALQRLADCLRHALRDTDFVARYGGDEFAIILPETSLEAARAIAQRLREDADRCCMELSDLPRGTASISLGLAAYPEDAISPGGLITAADQALYRYKQSYHLANR